MLDIPSILAALSVKRPMFHSEADFQHTLAWEIHQQLPDASIRLEQAIFVQNVTKPLYLDILVTHKGATLALELKYKTRALTHSHQDEQFKLLNHSAQDLGRYDFIKDICRLEQVTSSRKNTTGYAILLTNDRTYWTPSSSNSSIDAAFRLHQTQVLVGNLGWGPDASVGVMKGRTKPLNLRVSYNLHWQDYSTPTSNSHGQFRYLLIKVEQPQ